ncbi:hypothetical protein QBC45DRAFT_422723 [Copromyces sp. CBS 386.78]|nr:hypothetical protein QBC45DRAFT_422723 [Copromyces sp. CBS 386.78]
MLVLDSEPVPVELRALISSITASGPYHDTRSDTPGKFGLYHQTNNCSPKNGGLSLRRYLPSCPALQNDFGRDQVTEKPASLRRPRIFCGTPTSAPPERPEEHFPRCHEFPNNHAKEALPHTYHGDLSKQVMLTPEPCVEIQLCDCAPSTEIQDLITHWLQSPSNSTLRCRQSRAKESPQSLVPATQPCRSWTGSGTWRLDVSR